MELTWMCVCSLSVVNPSLHSHSDSFIMLTAMFSQISLLPPKVMHSKCRTELNQRQLREY